MAKKTAKHRLTEKEKEYYDMLMKARGEVTEQMKFCADNALDSSNAEKRGVTTHMADVSSDTARREMELRMLTDDGDVISLIDDALERLMNGEYGYCLDCGEPISEARLKARPYAIFCIKCKSRHEQMMNDR